MASPTVWYEKHEAKCIKEMGFNFTRAFSQLGPAGEVPGYRRNANLDF